MKRLTMLSLSLVAISLMFTGQSFARIDLETCVGMWLFDEGKGDVAKDSSGNGNDGKIQGAAWAKGKFGTALEFNGTDDNVEVPDAPNLNPAKAMSMGCWVYITGNQGQHRDIISKDGESGERQYLLTASAVDKFRAHIWTPDGVARYFDGKTSVELNTWYHIFQTYDGSALKLYVNGTEEDSRDFPGGIIVTKQPVRIGGGANPGAAAYHTPGTIDEVVIFNVALEKEEIRAIMDDGLSNMLAVSPLDKLATIWGNIKNQH
ncbi:MAG: LamG domain-containing protein [Candidatus Poribacteria bacterium]